MYSLTIKTWFNQVSRIQTNNKQWQQSLSERLAVTYQRVTLGRVNELAIKRLEQEVNAFLIEHGIEIAA